jgi:hypothetical protein
MLPRVPSWSWAERAGCPSWGPPGRIREDSWAGVRSRARSVCVQWTVTWSSWTWSTKSFISSAAASVCCSRWIPGLIWSLLPLATVSAFTQRCLPKKNLSELLQAFSLDAVETAATVWSDFFIEQNAARPMNCLDDGFK